jgi:hypothetical protein
MMMRGTCSILAGALVILAACQDQKGVTPPPHDPLYLTQDLSSHCFHWPDVDFTRANFADALASRKAGDQAVEFQLQSVDGRLYQLSELLATRPVLLVLGSFT